MNTKQIKNAIHYRIEWYFKEIERKLKEKRGNRD